MTCPRCARVNAADAAFCQECGGRLEVICSGCGVANASDANFCKRCGQRLASVGSRPAPGAAEPATAGAPARGPRVPRHLAEKILTSRRLLEGERKQVTVLFADLKSSMEMLADRDPEEARKLLDPVVELMMEAVHRYEGTVNQVMGDGIMALFGAPLAHEDHAVRACYAALRMQDRMKRYAEEARRAHGVSVQIRVGCNSGEVVVGAIAGDLHMEYTAVGGTTHLASRMEQLATPGTILVTASTLELVEGYVAVKALGPVPVRGMTDPVEIYEVTGTGPARTRLQAAARRGLTRFVGRDAEIEHLRRVQQRAADGHGQLVAIVGDAGVGKSRLVYEFTHSHRMQGWLALESASVSYGKATSYLPVIELLRGYFKIQDRDDLREIREKVTGKVLTLDEGLRPSLPALLALLDAPVDDAAWPALAPTQRRQRTLDAVTEVLLREARQQPLLLIFEDLHWIDADTQALLDGLVPRLPSVPLLLLVNYRPEYAHGWRAVPAYSELALEALAPESAGELLHAMLGGDPGLQPLKALLAERRNPFFLEETIRTLVETRALTGERGGYRLAQPLRAIAVPPTVQALLAARIDRLRPEDKHVLQVASVVGKDVPWALLQAIAELPEDALRLGVDRLQAADFLYESGLFPDLEYTFKHALTHEVTYGGLLHERRRELHGRLVEAIESQHADRLGEHVERLAHHARRGELGAKAVHYLRQAGLKAAGRSSLADARTWFEHALTALEALPDSPALLEQAFDVRIELRPVLNQMGEVAEMVQRLGEAAAVAEKLDDDRRRCRVHAYMTNARCVRGELDEALASGGRALALALALGDLELRILTTSYLNQAHYIRGDYLRTVGLATENLAALPADWAHRYLGRPAPPSVYDRYYLAMSLAQLGRFGEAAARGAEAIELAERMQHPFTLTLAHQIAGMVHLLRGDWAKARAPIERWVAVARAGNIAITLPSALAASAWVLAELGEAGEALARLEEGERGLEDNAARGIASSRAWLHVCSGHAALGLGRLELADDLGRRAVEAAPAEPAIAAHARHLLGVVASRPDRLDAPSAVAHFRAAQALAEPRGMRPLLAHCRLGLGAVAARTADGPSAREHLAAAVATYREMDMPFWAGAAEAELGRLGA